MLTGEGNYKVGLKRSFHFLDSAMQQAVNGDIGEKLSNFHPLHSLQHLVQTRVNTCVKNVEEPQLLLSLLKMGPSFV